MNLLISFSVERDHVLRAQGHTFLGVVPPLENWGGEAHVWLKKGEKLAECPPYVEGKLDAFQMEQELRRLSENIDLSCVQDVDVLRHYIEVLDSAYMQQAATLRGLRNDNREIWESNERIMKELKDQIAELKSKSREA